MKLTTAELVYINEAGKALKQKDFMIIDRYLIGLDNILNILSYVTLDASFIPNIINGMIINQRELSAFIKTIALESEFDYNDQNTVLTTMADGALLIKYDNKIADVVYHKFKLRSYFDSIEINEEEINDIMLKLQAMNKADGALNITHNGYFMTIFPSVLPSNKSDKMFIKIYDYGTEIFTARFRVRKKKFNVITYMSYIKV